MNAQIFKKSTQVAAKILKGLYDKFGDWLLVIAAYNAGVGGVKRAISKSGSDNFGNCNPSPKKPAIM